MDCFGSSVGISSVVKQLGKPCKIILGADTTAIDYFLSKLKSDPKYDNLFISKEELMNKLMKKLY